MKARMKKHEIERLKTVVQMAEKYADKPETNIHIVIIKDFILRNDPDYDWVDSHEQFKQKTPINQS